MCTHTLSLSLAPKAVGTRTPTRHPQIGPLWPAVQLNRPILTLTHIEVLRSELSILLIGRRGLRARALSLFTRAHSARRLLRVQRISQFAHGTPPRSFGHLNSSSASVPVLVSVTLCLHVDSRRLIAPVSPRPCPRPLSCCAPSSVTGLVLAVARHKPVVLFGCSRARPCPFARSLVRPCPFYFRASRQCFVAPTLRRPPQALPTRRPSRRSPSGGSLPSTTLRARRVPRESRRRPAGRVRRPSGSPGSLRRQAC